ncbi:hypothetical protein [Geodermatophilus sp. DSM 44513]|uniref:hypothetical protein n=1 Tax=Geodermatophilus sp. DSM 44513 TaxID=1528104 RepID=UPI00127449C0|nr:hypothetical protein [Geodermatophilus sp. DSM 44513]WNV76811.1 hypothetical protein RTG05_05920 [Geodermatophilus sp. DSM 44513]
MTTTRTTGRIALTAALALAGSIAVASPALAEDLECRGTLGAVTVTGNLLVPDDATCVLDGTSVLGTIVVKSRSTLQATAVEATGGLQGESPSTVVVRGSEFGNGVALRKAELNAGRIELTGNTVTGDVQLAENRNPIRVEDNDVVGSVQAEKNTGGTEITGNRIGNGLQCQANLPAPVGGGNVAKQKQGQCVAL